MAADQTFDVVVIGACLAGMSAATSATEVCSGHWCSRGRRRRESRPSLTSGGFIWTAVDGVSDVELNVGFALAVKRGGGRSGVRKRATVLATGGRRREEEEAYA